MGSKKANTYRDNDQFEKFQSESFKEYFKMQEEADDRRRRFYRSCVIITIFLPLLIASLTNCIKYINSTKEDLEMEEQKNIVNELVTKLLLDDVYLSSIEFKNNVGVIEMEDLYQNHGLTLELYDPYKTYQCMGYVLVYKDGATYTTNLENYCKL